MMPLTVANKGEAVTIMKVLGKEELCRHLAELGFNRGGQVTVVNEALGNFILQVKDGRVALDGATANRIMVC